MINYISTRLVLKINVLQFAAKLSVCMYERYTDQKLMWGLFEYISQFEQFDFHFVFL